MKPLFSIIVPSYNRNREVNDLLVSLEGQTMQNFEVVVVDDCSPTAIQISGDYTFPVQLYRNPQNAGPAQSRNQGAELAKGEWLLFLDDDDRFAENKCKVIGQTITQNPQANFIYHPAQCEMVNEKFTYITKPITNEQDLTLENILLANKIGGMPMLAVRKDFFQQLNGLSTDLKSLEDYDFVLKAVTHSNFQPKYIAQPLSLCSFHTERKSVSTNMENTEKAIEQIAKKYVQSTVQKKRFSINRLYMLSYPLMMNLSRKAAWYYWQIFKLTKNIKHLAIAMIILVSPKLAINLKRYL